MTFKTDPVTGQAIVDAEVVYRDAAGNPVPLDVTHPQPVDQGYYGADTQRAVGSVTGPTAGLAIAQIATPGPGVWEITVIASFEGTAPAAADRDNVQLRPGATSGNWVVIQVPLAVTTPVTVRFARCTLLASDNITVVANGAGTAGTIYRATIVATRLHA